MGGRNDHQLADPLGEGLGEGQADAAPVGSADEGVDHRLAQFIEQQGQQPSLIMGGQGNPRLFAARQVIEGEHPQAVQINGPALTHGPGPPAGREPARRNAPGGDHQRPVLRPVQAADDLGRGEALAGSQTEVRRYRRAHIHAGTVVERGS